jgi:hypothetical protein
MSSERNFGLVVYFDGLMHPDSETNYSNNQLLHTNLAKDFISPPSIVPQHLNSVANIEISEFHQSKKAYIPKIPLTLQSLQVSHCSEIQARRVPVYPAR